MKIRKIQIKNYLGVEELEINVNNDKVMIEGGNGVGKSSVLEAIENALNSTASRRPQKVRNGNDSSMLLLELDDGTEIRRTLIGDSNKLEVKKDGTKLSSPETYLKSLFNGFSFNPVDFLQKKDKEQTAILLRLLPFQITPQDAQEWFGEIPNVNYDIHGLLLLNLLAEDYYYNKRAVANKDVKEIENQIKALDEQIPVGYDYHEWENTSAGSVYDKISQARQQNGKLQSAELRIQEIQSEMSESSINVTSSLGKLQKSVDDQLEELANVLNNTVNETKGLIKQTENEIADLENLIVQKRNKIEQYNKDIENDMAHIENEKKHCLELFEQKKNDIVERESLRLDKLKDESDQLRNFTATNKPIGIDTLLDEAKEIEHMKSFVMLAKNRESLKNSRNISEKSAMHLDNLVEFCRNKPKEIIAQAQMPIEGLGINEQGNITINEIPIRNLSTSEQLNLAIEIAKATSGKLKIICIDKFESMDEESQRLFSEKTKDDGYTYFITQVSTGELKINQGE